MIDFPNQKLSNLINEKTFSAQSSRSKKFANTLKFKNWNSVEIQLRIENTRQFSNWANGGSCLSNKIIERLLIDWLRKQTASLAGTFWARNRIRWLKSRVIQSYSEGNEKGMRRTKWEERCAECVPWTVRVKYTDEQLAPIMWFYCRREFQQFRSSKVWSLNSSEALYRTLESLNQDRPKLIDFDFGILVGYRIRFESGEMARTELERTCNFWHSNHPNQITITDAFGLLTWIERRLVGD